MVALVTKATVLFYPTPVRATLFAYILRYERFSFSRWFVIISGTTGCLLVIRVNPFAFEHDNADLLRLISGMVWAAGSVMIWRYLNACFMHITFMQYLSPELVGILMLSEVLVAALLSWLFLHETLTPWQWVGVVAILGTRVLLA